jgi:hypothetical protein
MTTSIQDLREEGTEVFEFTATDIVWIAYLTAASLFYSLLFASAEPDPTSESTSTGPTVLPA